MSDKKPIIKASDVEVSPLTITNVIGVSREFLQSLEDDTSLYFRDEDSAMVCLQTAKENKNGLNEVLKKAGFNLGNDIVMFDR